MINLIFGNYLLLDDGINLSFFSTINSENGQFCKAHRWRLKGFLCSVCCLKHWSLTCQIKKKKNIWKTLGIFTLPLCDLLTLRTPSVKWPFRIWPLQLWGFLLCCCGKSDIKCHRRLSKKKTYGLWKTSVWRAMWPWQFALPFSPNKELLRARWYRGEGVIPICCQLMVGLRKCKMPTFYCADL